MIRVNERNKLWSSAFCPFQTLIITLYQVEIIFSLHPDKKFHIMTISLMFCRWKNHTLRSQ